MLEKREYYRTLKEISKGGETQNVSLLDDEKKMAFYMDEYFSKEIFKGRCSRGNTIDCIYKEKYFIEFKSGKIDDIKRGDLHRKIALTMVVYFGEKEKDREYSKENNRFYLVVENGMEKIWTNMTVNSMKKEIEENYKKNDNYKTKNLYLAIKEYEGFCFKECEIKTIDEFKAIINKNE